MNIPLPVPLALAIAMLASPVWAVPDDAHLAHHPADSVSTPSAVTKPVKSGPNMARMDMQMQAMHEMHGKMMAAKTLDERKALMATQTKIMQDGMIMMSGVPANDTSAMKGSMASHHQMMEKRMDMMQAMMQMMMDRQSAVGGEAEK